MDAVEVVARAIAQRFMPGPERDRYLLNGGCTPIEAARAALAALEAEGFTLLRRPPPQTAAAPLVSANEVHTFVRIPEPR